LDVVDVTDALAQQLGRTAGGHHDDRGDERVGVRAQAQPTTPEGVDVLTVATREGVPVTVQDVGWTEESGALTVGLGTADGRGEALFGMVQLLAGGDARATVAGVRAIAEELRTSLPE